MKKVLIALLMSVVASIASAAPSQECVAELKGYFEEYKPVAASIAPVADRKDILDITLKFEDVEHAYGSADMWDTMRLSSVLCKESSDYKRGVVAHEFGHLVSFKLLPDYAPRTRPKVTVWQQEWVANEIGAQILRSAKVDTSAYIAEISEKCEKGTRYFCDKKDAWLSYSSY